MPKSWPFYGWYRVPSATGLLPALGRTQRPSGPWGGTKKSAVLTADPPRPHSPETLSRELEISNSRAINKIVLRSPSNPLHTMLFCSRKSASLQGATDWRTPAGIQVLPMASVGEPINRLRHIGQRDRSQTVLAAPRDTRSRTLIKPRPGRP